MSARRSQVLGWKLPCTFALLTLLFGMLLSGFLSFVAYRYERAHEELLARDRAISIAEGLVYVTEFDFVPVLEAV